MESNFFYNTHFDYIEHWQRYERHNILFQRLINILTQANWNKRIVRNPNFILMTNDLEIHRNRFDRYIKTVETICFEIMREIVRVNRAHDADKFVVYASSIVADALLGEESHMLAELEVFVSKQIKIQTELLYHQDKFDVVMM